MTKDRDHVVTASHPRSWRCSCGFVCSSGDVAERHLATSPEVVAAADGQRRAAIAWMLHAVGLSHANVAQACGISTKYARQLVADYDKLIERRIAAARFYCATEPWARRLFAAGAIR